MRAGAPATAAAGWYGGIRGAAQNKDVKCFTEAINSKALAELSEMLARVAAVADKLVAFQRETASRESANLGYEAARGRSGGGKGPVDRGMCGAPLRARWRLPERASKASR